MDDNFIAKLEKKNSENIKRFEENLNKLERKITTPIGKKIELLNQVPPRKSRYDDKTNKIIFYGDPIDNTENEKGLSSKNIKEAIDTVHKGAEALEKSKSMIKNLNLTNIPQASASSPVGEKQERADKRTAEEEAAAAQKAAEEKEIKYKINEKKIQKKQAAAAQKAAQEEEKNLLQPMAKKEPQKNNPKSTKSDLDSMFDNEVQDTEEKAAAAQKAQEEVNNNIYEPLKITNINSSSSEEEITGNGSNQCWLNSVLYLFFSLKQVTDKCDPLHNYTPIETLESKDIEFRQQMYDYLKNIQTDNYLWNKKNYDELTKKFIEEIRVQRICNQTEYGKGDIETLQKTLDSPYEYGDHQIALKYIFSLIIACNFNKLDLILFNSVAMPKNLRELFENKKMKFISNDDDRIVLNNFNEKQMAEIGFAQYDQIYYNDTNRELLSNILTKQFELMYEKKNLGTYECVAFIISTNYIDFEGRNNGEHYVTYVRKGKSSGKKWVRWDAYKINDKDEEVVELNTSKDLFEIENSKKENEKMEIKDTENSYRYFTPLFLRITGTGDLDINKSGQLIKKFAEDNAKANKSSSVAASAITTPSVASSSATIINPIFTSTKATTVTLPQAAPATTTPPPSTKANSDNSETVFGLMKRGFSGLFSKNEETEPLLTKKGGKRKTKKNRKRKTNKKLNKLSNNSSNKKRIKKKKKSLKH